MGLAIIVALTVYFQRNLILDWVYSLSYSPTPEMATIRDELDLTSRGLLLFNALSPTLDDASTFNQACVEEGNEVATLGCFTANQIHVYNIVSPEFAGIREVTAAHELLHAVWGRLSDAEREAYTRDLLAALTDSNASADSVVSPVEIDGQALTFRDRDLAEELAVYAESERAEELYVRAATEIHDLPENLNAHYATFFNNRAAIVDFYDSYIAVFRETRAHAEALEQEIASLKETIEAEIPGLEAESADLDAKISAFNACSVTAGCFSSRAAFDIERSILVAEQAEFIARSENLNDLIIQHNDKVNEYNQNIARSEELQAMINSTSAPAAEL